MAEHADNAIKFLIRENRRDPVARSFVLTSDCLSMTISGRVIGRICDYGGPSAVVANMRIPFRIQLRHSIFTPGAGLA